MQKYCPIDAYHRIHIWAYKQRADLTCYDFQPKQISFYGLFGLSGSCGALKTCMKSLYQLREIFNGVNVSNVNKQS